MPEMNHFERLVADEMSDAAGPVLPVDDRAIFERASAAGSPIMHGENAYEGLTAYVVVDEESGPITFSAVIFPGDMPTPPMED